MDAKVKKIFDQINPIGGWLKDEEAESLIETALKLKGGNVVEVGTGLGKSTAIFALASPKSRVYTIDNMTARFHIDMSEKEFRERCTRNWDSVGVTSQIVLRIGDFRDWNWHGEIELLFIEGEQTYKEALDTFNKFEKYVVKGGYVVIRDYLTKAYNHEHGRFVDEVLAKDKHYKTHIKGQFVWAKKK